MDPLPPVQTIELPHLETFAFGKFVLSSLG